MFVFCCALTQLKQKNTKTYWAAEAKAADELGGDVQCCTAGLGWEGRQNRSFLSQSWVIPSSSLHCLCCLFQKALHSHFLLKVVVPAACFKPTAFFLLMSLWFFFFYCFCLERVACATKRCTPGFWETQCLKCLLVDVLLRQITVLSCFCESAQMLCRSHEKNSFPWLLLKTCWVH